MKTIKLGSKIIGDDSLYFIADIGANHDGSLDKAIELINLAKKSGADAAKFQNFTADKIVSKSGFDNMKNKLSHQAKWKKSVFEVYKDASINKDWTPILKNECKKIGIDYFTSPYDFDSVDLVDPYVDLYKIGSGDISWLEIVDYILSKNKPTLIATGACDLDDVKRVMKLAKSRSDKIVLMQCNTNYTGSLDNFKYTNLNVLKNYRKLFPDLILGLSDHTPGHATTLGAITLGVRVIEKHFTDNNYNEGPDHSFAMNPESWKEMVDRSNELLLSLGDGKKIVEENEKDSYYVQRRSICVSLDLKKGDIITPENIFPLRPFKKNAFHPYEKYQIINKILLKDIKKGEAILKNNIK